MKKSSFMFRFRVFILYIFRLYSSWGSYYWGHTLLAGFVFYTKKWSNEKTAKGGDPIILSTLILSFSTHKTRQIYLWTELLIHVNTYLLSPMF